MSDVRIRVTAEWNELEITARELANLKQGDVLQLDPRCTAGVTIRLGGLPRFRARLGTQDRKWAAQLTEFVRA